MQRFTRFALPVLCAAGLFTAPSSKVSAAAADVETLERLALVDVQRCLLETKQGKKAKTDLEKTFAKGQAKIDKKNEALQKRLADLQAKQAMLSESELRKRQEELMRGQAELEQLSYELQQEVAQKEELLTEKIYNNVAAIVKQVALEEKLQVVLVRSEMTVLYADPRLDLTNKIIVRYDKEHTK